MFGEDNIPSDPAFIPGALVRLETRTSEFQSGQILVVDRIDNDGTFIGRAPDTGRESSWINCRHAVVVPVIGWEFLQTALTPRGRKLLEAFDGHRQLRLKSAITDQLVRTVPDLTDAIIETHQELQASSAASASGPRRGTPKRPPRGRPPPPRRHPESPPLPDASPALNEADFDLPRLSFGSWATTEAPEGASARGVSHG